MEYKNIEFWIIDFVDSYGHFSVNFTIDARGFNKIRPRPTFILVGGFKSSEELQKVKAFFKCGRIESHEVNKITLYTYAIRNLKDVYQILSFFQKYKLSNSVKQRNFEIFAHICNDMQRDRHLDQNCLKTIIEKAYTMNLRFDRKYTKAELFAFLEKP